MRFVGGGDPVADAVLRLDQLLDAGLLELAAHPADQLAHVLAVGFVGAEVELIGDLGPRQVGLIGIRRLAPRPVQGLEELPETWVKRNKDGQRRIDGSGLPLVEKKYERAIPSAI